jgi:hypothetical protein
MSTVKSVKSPNWKKARAQIWRAEEFILKTKENAKITSVFDEDLRIMHRPNSIKEKDSIKTPAALTALFIKVDLKPSCLIIEIFQVLLHYKRIEQEYFDWICANAEMAQDIDKKNIELYLEFISNQLRFQESKKIIQDGEYLK